MFKLSGVNYEEVFGQVDSILVRDSASSSYRGFELSGLYCTMKFVNMNIIVILHQALPQVLHIILSHPLSTLVLVDFFHA